MRFRIDRAGAWRRHGAQGAEVAELLEYSISGFADLPPETPRHFPLPDEPFVQAWDRYVEQARAVGVEACLRRVLVQLQFPIEAGMGEHEGYRAATRRGVLPPAPVRGGVEFASPGGLRIFLHPTPAGRIPVVACGERSDFEALVRAVTCRNEPRPLPRSMGACIVSGYNNWDRVHALREEWTRNCAGVPSDEAWAAAFQALQPRRELYQDRFVLLSQGPYSGVPATAMNLEPDEWLQRSFLVRLEHEATHYFTRRVFGAMRNSLIDELAADYAGIRAAVGRFRAEWFLRFMGLEHPSGLRAGGRLANYRGDPPLSDGAFRALQSAVRSAAVELEAWDLERPPVGRDADGTACLTTTIVRAGLETLSAPGARHMLNEVFQDESRSNRAEDPSTPAGMGLGFRTPEGDASARWANGMVRPRSDSAHPPASAPASHRHRSSTSRADIARGKPPESPR